MFFIAGETDSEKKRGVVVDKCLCCGRVTALGVTQTYRRSHIYFIPLSSGKLIATTLKCRECKGKMAAQPGAYARMIPEKQAAALSTGELLEQTNPSLARAIVDRAQLERDAREGYRSAGGPDPRVALAFTKLGEIGVGSAVHGFQARLSQWAVLDPAAQTALLNDIDGLHADHERRQAVVYLIRQMTQKFKPEVDGCLGFLTFIVASVLSLALVGYVLSVLDASGPVVLGAVVATLVADLVLAWRAHAAVRRRSHKRFFRTVFMPAADEQGVDIADVVATLGSVNTSDDQIDPKLRGMAGAIALLMEALAEDGRHLDDNAS